MSVLIKGERMPNNCMDCKMASEDKWYECPFYAIMVEDYSDKRFENCPLVEVPGPHGRLIDADKYFNKVLDEANGINDKELADNFIELSHWLLEKAPTVIEAEGEQ